MDNFFLWIKLLIATCVAMVGHLLGGIDGMIVTLVSLTVIDYATGVIKAVHERELSSRIGYLGILKKVCIFFVVAVSFQIGELTGMEEIRMLTVSFYITNECISVLENMVLIGVPLPENLVNALKGFKGGKKD